MTWYYQGEPYTTAPDEYQGYVYCITNTQTGRRYIGKKNFWRIKKLPPLKGKKNRRHRRIETDWQNYYGSNAQLQQDAANQNYLNIHREILHLCPTKTWMSYHETRLQFELNVLTDPSYYNDFISCRLNSTGLK